MGMENGPAIAAWAECSNATAVAAGVALAQGRFDETEELGDAAQRLMRWAGFPPAAQLLYPVLACARTLRGNFDEAHAALDAWESVSSPGVRRFRALVHAHAGNLDEVPPHRARTLSEAPKTFELASIAAAIEIGDLIHDIERIEWAMPGIEYFAERGVRFDLGWCTFVPRLAGVAALRLDRLDDARRWLDLATTEAERSGATIEATRVADALARLQTASSR